MTTDLTDVDPAGAKVPNARVLPPRPPPTPDLSSTLRDAPHCASHWNIRWRAARSLTTSPELGSRLTPDGRPEPQLFAHST
jgi:hypothetical protein